MSLQVLVQHAWFAVQQTPTQAVSPAPQVKQSVPMALQPFMHMVVGAVH
jgi:hypothetical protein